MNYTNEHMSFALGYYHGRAEGYEHQPEADNDVENLRHWYRMGYDKGVADYCQFDEPQSI